jgi:hypothetical protein
MTNDLEWIRKAWQLYFEFGDSKDIDYMHDTMEKLIAIIYQQNKTAYPHCVVCGKVIHVAVFKNEIYNRQWYCEDCKYELDNYMKSLDEYYNAMNKKSD